MKNLLFVLYLTNKEYSHQDLFTMDILEKN
jgi:hypothetical protein